MKIASSLVNCAFYQVKSLKIAILPEIPFVFRQWTDKNFYENYSWSPLRDEVICSLPEEAKQRHLIPVELFRSIQEVTSRQDEIDRDLLPLCSRLFLNSKL